MRITAIFVVVLTFLVGCASKPEATKPQDLKVELFGTWMGMTQEQLISYGELKALDVDGLYFSAQTLPENYDLNLNQVIYTIGSKEGLCAVSIVDDSNENIAELRRHIEEQYGKPSIDKTNKFTTWDNEQDDNPVITINYGKNKSQVQIFYSNFDRCRTK